MRSTKFIKHTLLLAISSIAIVFPSCSSKPTLAELPAPEYRVTTVPQGLVLTTSDSLLAARFEWAAQQALSYAHHGDDPVGKWYEAALPDREAFCMRDVAHQSAGAHYLGLDAHTKNMLFKFADNISPSRDWCSFWEINRYDKPAPVDYANDNEFWYNLPANFDVLIACWKQYQRTADIDYLQDPTFSNFYQITVGDYITTWNLSVDSLMTRDRFMNLRVPFDSSNSFHYSRGLPSYDEGNPLQLYLGADLICLQFQAYKTYGSILKAQGRVSETDIVYEEARKLGEFFNTVWWDSTSGQYYSARLMNGEFVSEPSRYVLLSGICQTVERQRLELARLLNRKEVNIESQSYLPVLYYQEDENQRAYEEIMDLTAPNKKRKEYPEVSYAVVEAVTEGMMGINSDASARSIITISRLTDATAWVSFENIPLFEGTINLTHRGNYESVFENKTDSPISWVARFPVGVETLSINGVNTSTRIGIMPSGKEISQVEMVVNEGETVTVTSSYQ